MLYLRFIYLYRCSLYIDNINYAICFNCVVTCSTTCLLKYLYSSKIKKIHSFVNFYFFCLYIYCLVLFHDDLNFETPVAIQLKKISLDRKESELSYFNNSKVIKSEYIKKTNSSTGRYCGICSESTSVIHPKGHIFFYSHTSSKTYRMNAPVDKWGSYPCFTCKKTPHSHKIGMRYPIMVLFSILNHWQGHRSANLYPGDDMHIDYITIPGATIKDLHHAFI